MTTDSSLAGTPYLFPTDDASLARLEIIDQRSVRARTRAIEVQDRIRVEASDSLQPYLSAIRSDLVAESNSIEGYDWSGEQVMEVVTTYYELLRQPIGTIVESLRHDPRVFQALGLYKAHELAENWAQSSFTPKQFEVRALHGLIMAGEHHAGRYKQSDNEIGGSALKTVPHWDAQRAMGELCEWWAQANGDPALVATVVHAWLTHIHPFEDGNGRMARLLANMALARQSYPPLLVRSSADRGQYYDCLAASDEGDLLPLYDLFVQIIRRTIRSMSAPGYVRDVVAGRLLISWRHRLSSWIPLLRNFKRSLDECLTRKGMSSALQGEPDLRSFALLGNLESEGNSWFLKILGPSKKPEWLLWFGYNSPSLCDALGGKSNYPSIFASVRDPSWASIHRYLYVKAGDGHFPDEILIRPFVAKPCLVRCGETTHEMSITEAASYVAESLAVYLAESDEAIANNWQVKPWSSGIDPTGSEKD